MYEYEKIWEYASAQEQRCGLCMYCGYTVDTLVGCMTISVWQLRVFLAVHVLSPVSCAHCCCLCGYIRGQLDLGSREGGGGSCIIMMIQGIPPCTACMGPSCAHCWCWCCTYDVVDDILRPSRPKLLSSIVFIINCTFSSRGLTTHRQCPHSLLILFLLKMLENIGSNFDISICYHIAW